MLEKVDRYYTPGGLHASVEGGAWGREEGASQTPYRVHRVGGILVIISFSPLIFPALFCCTWRIKWEMWGTSNLVPGLYPFRRGPFFKSPGDKAEAPLVSKKYVWCSYGKGNFRIIHRGSVRDRTTWLLVKSNLPIEPITRIAGGPRPRYCARLVSLGSRGPSEFLRSSKPLVKQA